MTIRALEVLDDPERYFISTIYVSMEVLPKATYFQRQEEIDFYNKYFAAVHEWVNCNENFLQLAFQNASTYGLSCVDALHTTAAFLADADEFITT